jgi:hypothetical protein
MSAATATNNATRNNLESFLVILLISLRELLCPRARSLSWC